MSDITSSTHRSRFIYINGMNTSPGDALVQAEELCRILLSHEINEGHSVELHYNDSLPPATTTLLAGGAGAAVVGLVTADAIESNIGGKAAEIRKGCWFTLLCAGVGLAAVVLRRAMLTQALAENLTSFLNESTSNRVTLVLHSQGAMIGANAYAQLSPEHQHRVHGITLGGATTMGHEFGDVGFHVNLQAHNDTISKFANAVSIWTGFRPTATMVAAGHGHGSADYMATRVFAQVVRRSIELHREAHWALMAETTTSHLRSEEQKQL